MKHIITSTVALAMIVGASQCVFARTYQVGDLRTLEQLVRETAEPGDVLEIQPGTYFLETDRIEITRSGVPENPIVIRGVMVDGKRPVIDASKVNVRRCVFGVGQGVHDLIFENLDICHAVGSRFPDRRRFGVNATAIFFDGCHNITVRNCVSHHNEDGFFATRTSDYILIDDCEIHHNGTTFQGDHNRTHNFYFCARHQMVKNSYIHHSTEGENFKSRGANTIFAFNWVDEEAIYSVAVDSGGTQNTLWLGNVVIKRTALGHGQGRLLGVGDGTGIATGKLVAINNTFLTCFPRDFYLYTHGNATGDVLLINNIFAGPGNVFLRHNGKGSISGSHNWIASGATGVPDTLADTLRGDDPGFVRRAAYDLRPVPESAVIDAGVSPEEYLRAIRLVTDNARSGSGSPPSPPWLKALEEVERPAPAFEPRAQDHGYRSRPVSGRLDIGAFEAAR